MKRILNMILVVVVVFGVVFLVGCNKTVDDPVADPGQSANTEETQEAAENETLVSEQEILDLVKKGEQVTEFSYDFSYSDGSTTKNGKCYYRDSLIRIEWQGENKVLIVDMDAITEYSTTTKKGSVWSFDEYAHVDHTTTPLNWINSLLNNPKFTYDGKEMYDNTECLMITVSNDPSGGPYVAWINTKTGLIVKVDGGHDRFEYKNIKAGSGTVPESLMKVPDDIEMENQ